MRKAIHLEKCNEKDQIPSEAKRNPRTPENQRKSASTGQRLHEKDFDAVELITLVQRYQKLDTEIQVSIKAAADSVG